MIVAVLEDIKNNESQAYLVASEVQSVSLPDDLEMAPTSTSTSGGASVVEEDTDNKDVEEEEEVEKMATPEEITATLDSASPKIVSSIQEGSNTSSKESCFVGEHSLASGNEKEEEKGTAKPAAANSQSLETITTTNLREERIAVDIEDGDENENNVKDVAQESIREQSIAALETLVLTDADQTDNSDVPHTLVDDEERVIPTTTWNVEDRSRVSSSSQQQQQKDDWNGLDLVWTLLPCRRSIACIQVCFILKTTKRLWVLSTTKIS